MEDPCVSYGGHEDLCLEVLFKIRLLNDQICNLQGKCSDFWPVSLTCQRWRQTRANCM